MWLVSMMILPAYISEQCCKYPHFVDCEACEQTFPDTQLASANHLNACSLVGFMKFHSVKVIDEPVVTEVDQKIFSWRQTALKTYKALPEVLVTLDGVGMGSNNLTREASNVTKKKLRNPTASMSDPHFQMKQYPVSRKVLYDDGSETEIVASVQLVHNYNHFRKKKTMIQEALDFPVFRNVVMKRVADFDIGENSKRSCRRKTKTEDLFEI